MRLRLPALLCLLGGVLMLGLQAWPRVGRPVAILFAPGTSPEQALLLTGGAGQRPMRLLRTSPVVILAWPDGVFRLPERAWLAFASEGDATCGDRPPSTRPGGARPWT